MKSKIGVIGLGNIGFSLANGLSLKSDNLTISAYDHNSHSSDRAKMQLKNVNLLNSTSAVIKNSDLVFVCIRTHQVLGFIAKYTKEFTKDKIFVFLSAGIKQNQIKPLLKNNLQSHFRAITNVNTLSGNGYSILLKNTNVKAVGKVAEILRLVGHVDTVESEEQLDLFSIISGCTPAIIALFYESLVESGINIGISKMHSTEMLKKVVFQTINTITDNNLNSRELIQRVCTPGGLVVKHLAELENETDFKEDIVNWLPKILRNL